MALTVLNIQASAQHENSVTRQLSDKVLASLGTEKITTRDLDDGLPLVDATWVGANFTPADDRSDAQKEALSLSDSLIGEIVAADTLVIGVPIYNFSVPASLKTWIDLICRAGVTFSYTPEGPVGLMTGKRAIILIASGGTPVGSDYDFASDYLKFILAFIGITDVKIIAADNLMADAEGSVATANDAIAKLS